MGTKIIKLLHVYKITGPFTFIDPTGHPVLSITGPTANLFAALNDFNEVLNIKHFLLFF
jgi:hypothetical protein